MNIGNNYQVKIIDIDTFGNGIAKVNNIVIFIKGAFLNEIIEIEIIDIKKRTGSAQWQFLLDLLHHIHAGKQTNRNHRRNSGRAKENRLQGSTAG